MVVVLYGVRGAMVVVVLVVDAGLVCDEVGEFPVPWFRESGTRIWEELVAQAPRAATRASIGRNLANASASGRALRHPALMRFTRTAFVVFMPFSIMDRRLSGTGGLRSDRQVPPIRAIARGMNRREYRFPGAERASPRRGSEPRLREEEQEPPR